ncbi:replication-relaxation family protein [Arthrobacter sp. 9MFCol3.1]|uniref:replication-relaxation family protein n=1 Tax=Arthrobacter sp. 9MFCol3.1 TaxID=1150398 RepID=UPI0018CC59A2|nr:replication-relaxation family protein [Arthrobacter sp. 9MFCol3.1]
MTPVISVVDSDTAVSFRIRPEPHTPFFLQSHDGTQVRVRRHLTRLVKLGVLKRMWGAYGGNVEYVYQLAASRARTPDMHTLDISELYVRLVEAGATDMTFLTEPWCHTRVGHVQLKPDFYLEVGGVSLWGELDRSAEWETQLTAKCRRYIQAIDSGHWPEDRAFPLVLWTVPDEARKRYLENIIRKLNEPELFKVVLFDEAAERLTWITSPSNS